MIDDFKKPVERRRAAMDTRRDSLPSQQGGPEFPETPQADSSPEPAFRTPEQAAKETGASKHTAYQDFLPPLEHHEALPAHASKDAPAIKRFFMNLRKPDLTKKQWIIIGAVLVILLGGGTAFALTRNKPAPVAKKTPAKAVAKPAPKPIISPLSGLVVTPEQQARPVTGVMIENSPDARPQSGLDQSSIVFEAIAEAGITRFLALYQDNEPGTIGPVRSSRPYFLDWAMAFDASYAHVGGSPDALQRIKDISVKDLDQFFNPGGYHRISTRFAPHNMYSSVAQLRELGISKGWDKSTFTSWVRKSKETPSAAPTAKSINFAVSGADYNVHYDYDPAKNVYNRSEGGEVHVDNETKAQLSPKVVIALAMPYTLMADGYHSQYNTIGSGQMLVFQDGTVTPGTWSKGQPKDQFTFKDAAGKDIPLNPGQTWVTVLKDIGQATYQP
jgi:hypothetical protein